MVLAQRALREQDRFIDVLTAEHGVIEILVKGASKITSKTGSATQLFAYSQFSLADRKHGRVRTLNSVIPIEIFYGLRRSVTAVALASYFSQVVSYSVLPRAGTPEILRLLLNTLHYLSEQSREEALLKVVFELRLASLLGFMPDVVMCRKCGAYLPSQLAFSVEEGCFCCRDCQPADTLTTPVNMPASCLQAMRHIVLSDFEKIFLFRLNSTSLKQLNTFTETFLQYHTDRHFPTLDYYKILHNETPHNLS